jgi:hypothetical protein
MVPRVIGMKESRQSSRFGQTLLIVVVTNSNFNVFSAV